MLGQPSSKLEVWCRDGYLEFADEAAFKKYYESELPLPPEVAKCFTSMLDAYHQVSRAYAEAISRLAAEPPSKHAAYARYTSALMLAKDHDPAFAKLLAQHQDAVRLEEDGEGGHLLKHRALGNRAAQLTGPKGVIKVGNIIRQFGHDYYRAVLDGDQAKIAQLSQFTTTSLADNVFVSPVTYNGVPASGSTGQTANRTPQFLNSCQNTQGLDRIIMQEVLENHQNEFQRGGFEYRVEVFAKHRPLAIFSWGSKLTCQLSINSGTFRSNWQQIFSVNTGWPGGFTNYGTFNFNNISRVINQSTSTPSPIPPGFSCTDRQWPSESCCASPPKEFVSEMIVIFARSADIFGTPTITSATFDIYGRNGTNCLMTR